VLGEVAAHPAQVDASAAETRYLSSMRSATELGMRPLLAHCHLGHGKLYGRTGKRERACEHLTTATAMYREMDMPFWFKQAEAEISEPA